MDTTTHINPAALRHLLRAADARQAHVAQAAGISPSLLSRLASGQRQGRNPALRDRIAAALGVATAAIECGCASPSDHRAVAAPAA